MIDRSPIQRLQATRGALRSLLQAAAVDAAPHPLPSSVTQALRRYPLVAVAVLSVGVVWWVGSSKRLGQPRVTVRGVLGALAWRVAGGLVLAAVRAAKR